MSVEIVTRTAMPAFEAELPRGFKPLAIEERDCPRYRQAEDGTLRIEQRRTRVVLYVTPEQDVAAQPYDIGPATGRGGITMPCMQVTEMAQAWEMLDWWERKDAELAEREKANKPLRTEAWLRSLEAINEERSKQNVSRFSIGYGGKKQRS